MAISDADKAKMVAARELIKEQRYNEARALLSGVQHPKAYEWLAQLNRIAPAMPTPQPPPVPREYPVPFQSYSAAPPQSFTTKLVLTVLLLFVGVVPGLIALVIFSREAKEAQAYSAVKLPGAQGLITLNRFIFAIIIIGLAFLVLFMLLPLIGYYL